jgi:hypothetical protein
MATVPLRDAWLGSEIGEVYGHAYFGWRGTSQESRTLEVQLTDTERPWERLQSGPWQDGL